VPLNGSGTYTLPGPQYPAVSGALILAATRNTIDADIAAAISTAFFKDGQSTPTANLPLGGFRFTGAGDAVGAQEYLTKAQVAAAAGSALVGYLQAGTGAATRTVQARLRQILYAEDFTGVDPTGATESTVGVQAALDSVVGPVELRFGAGTFVLDALKIRRSGTVLRGSGRWVTTLKGKTAANYVLQTDNLAAASGVSYITDLVIADMTIDRSNLVNAVGSAGIILWNSYNNLIQNVLFTPRIIQAVNDLNFGQGVYTTRLINVDGDNFQFSSPNSDRVTTITMMGCSCTFLNLNNALGIVGVNTTVQGTTTAGYPVNMIQISNAYSVTFIGGDFEGNAARKLYTLTNVVGLKSINNNLNGFSGTLLVDSGGNSRIEIDDGAPITFAAGITLGGGSVTLTANTLSFERAGNRCRFWGRIIVNTVTTPSGSLTITGIPVTAAGGNQNICPIHINLDGFGAGATEAMGVVIGTSVVVKKYAVGAQANTLGADVLAGASIDLYGEYAV
jgi:hypothetical protein